MCIVSPVNAPIGRGRTLANELRCQWFSDSQQQPFEHSKKTTFFDFGNFPRSANMRTIDGTTLFKMRCTDTIDTPAKSLTVNCIDPSAQYRSVINNCVVEKKKQKKKSIQFNSQRLSSHGSKCAIVRIHWPTHWPAFCTHNVASSVTERSETDHCRSVSKNPRTTRAEENELLLFFENIAELNSTRDIGRVKKMALSGCV